MEQSKNQKCYVQKKGQPGALKFPHTQGPGRVPPFGVLYATLPCFFYTRVCFQDLNLWPSSHMTTT